MVLNIENSQDTRTNGEKKEHNGGQDLTSDVSLYNANGILKPQALIDIERDEKQRKRRCTVEA